MNEAQVQVTDKAPSKERPTQINDTTKSTVFEALCGGLTRASIPRKAMNRAVMECMDALAEAGVFRTIGDTVREAVPATRIQASYSVHYVADERLTKDQAEEIAAAVVAQFGGSVEHKSYTANPELLLGPWGVVRVAVDRDTEVCAFYDVEEQPRWF